jgi:hypothetical protein
MTICAQDRVPERPCEVPTNVKSDVSRLLQRGDTLVINTELVDAEKDPYSGAPNTNENLPTS